MLSLSASLSRAGSAAAALALALGLSAGPARAAEQMKALVTPEEAAQGWIALFDGETTYGWNPIGDAEWKVEGGLLVCENGSGGSLRTSSQFQDFEAQIQIRVRAESREGVAVRAGCDGHVSENGSAVLYIDEPKGSAGDWHLIKIKAEGSKLTATIDDAPVPNFATTHSRGPIELLYNGRHFDRNRKAGKLEVSSICLRPLNLKSLFNGKDLAGWNIIPDHKSEFSVIDGALNIKNGNGQIETADTFKNFALQLKIFSNGDHLNSGVFYRGPVGVFWKGYESQVRNQWNGQKAEDPKAGERTQPIDFGTGGNYGNQNSRKVVSTDREWFTKTVVVTGNHASIYINGYQTSDFTDVRPISPEKDGKVGYVPGPGTIHLQGHDPTTDLSFKDIMIQAYAE